MAESIGIVSGTGKEGSALARRWAHAGREVILGSRDAGRAVSVAAKVAAAAGGRVLGMTNADACGAADIVVVATPFDGLSETIEGCVAQLGGKLVVSAVIPLQVTAGRFTMRLIPEGSAAQLVAERAPRARVAASFHNVSYQILADLSREIEEDIPFTAAEEDVDAVRSLCSHLGVRGVHVGGLHLAPYLEGYTAVLLSVNRLHHTQAGIRFTGLPETG